ncbi:hypothetical protein Sya03_34890 [Spirilliplanes yamanashiensis]|uniref:Uncharacterized protein n=1 Tax=Spirilliplanes yamanashiensis TaxID=42233 RepID=A0A8J4DJF4_9ACTN|nr:hypothetical protein Sya03_34890 [Spirilliplanes yamanashiensis]
MLPHLAADVGQDLVTVGQFHPEHRVRQWLDDPAFDLDGSVFLRHVLRYLTSASETGSQLPSRPVSGAGPAAAPGTIEALMDMPERTLRAS